MSEEKQTRKRYNDGLTGMMVLTALIDFTTGVADKTIKNNREQFDAILVEHHNMDMPRDKHIDASYIEENSNRVSQKFSVLKSRLKDLGQEIHINLPRRSRSVGSEQIASLKSNPSWDAFMKLNKKVRNDKVHSKK